jgi:hypothetical protein
LIRAHWQTAVLIGVAVLLLAPQLRTRSHGWNGSHYGWPTIDDGDEPHYLIMLNSVIQDGDLDLRNNYDSVGQGSHQAGARYGAGFLDRHVSFWINGQRFIASQVFYPYINSASRRVLPGFDPALASAPEYGAHSPGIALLLAPFLFPFRHTSLVEPMACLASALATLGAFLFLRALLRQFTEGPWALTLTAVAAVLGTPLWNYSRTFFIEPDLALAVTAAFALALRRGAFLASGFFVGAAVLMKPPLALLCVPLALLVLRLGGWRARAMALLKLGALPVVAVALTLWMNDRMYGSPWHGPQPFYWGNVLTGAKGLLFSADRGLILWAPVTALAVLGWPWVLKKRPLEGASVLLGFLVFFVIMATWKYWDGGWCYGARLIVPAVPLLMVGMTGLWDLRLAQRLPARVFLVCVVIASCAIQEELVRTYWIFKAEYTSPLRWWQCVHGGDCL